MNCKQIYIKDKQIKYYPNRQQSKCYLNLCEILCIGLIINTRNKKHALLAAVLISCLPEFKVENNLLSFYTDQFQSSFVNFKLHQIDLVENESGLNTVLNRLSFCKRQIIMRS
jgi:hypothetical protein